MKAPGHALQANVLHLPECDGCQGASTPSGHGICLCGAVGSHETSYAGRRSWHMEHIDSVLRLWTPQS